MINLEARQKGNHMTTVPLSIVIPVFNETDNIGQLIEEIIQACHLIKPLEIIIVDDASTDDTWNVLKVIKQTTPALRLIQHQHNSGQTAAIITGVKAASHEIIATLDGDGQNDPNDIIKMLNTWQQQTATNVMIMGHRVRRKDTLAKRLPSKIANKIHNILFNDNCNDTGCGIKMFKRDDFLTLPHVKNIHHFLPALFTCNKIKVINIPVNHRPRTKGQSKYGFFSLFSAWIIDVMGILWLKKRNVFVRSKEIKQKTPHVNSTKTLSQNSNDPSTLK